MSPSFGEPDRVWIIYCEGYHDRDFLGGLFEDALQLQNLQQERRFEPGVDAYGRARPPAPPLEIQVKPGRKDDKKKAPQAFANHIEMLNARPAAGLVLCLDEDDAPDVVDARRRAVARIAELFRSRFASLAFDTATSSLLLVDGTRVPLLPVTWCCASPASDEIPPRQNLERLVVSACCAAHPDRGALVRDWLASRTDPPRDPASIDKAFSWSHMAGWFPSPGGQSFFRSLWQQDPAIRAALRARMADTGIDAVLAAMGIPPTAGE